jgi:hypothetical protein
VLEPSIAVLVRAAGRLHHAVQGHEGAHHQLPHVNLSGSGSISFASSYRRTVSGGIDGRSDDQNCPQNLKRYNNLDEFTLLSRTRCRLAASCSTPPDTTTARIPMRTDKDKTPQPKTNDKARDLAKQSENVELNVEELEERIAPRKAF